ncbi:MAG: hypothetical protein ACC654_07700, partial [Acidimicrobiia bacterium]
GRKQFDNRRETELFNRLLFEQLPDAVVPSLLKRSAESVDLLSRLRRHWAPNVLKSAVAKAALPRFRRVRLERHDRACHSETCECVWCTHGEDCAAPQECGSREAVTNVLSEPVEAISP